MGMMSEMDHDLQTARAFSDQQICRQQLAVSLLLEVSKSFIRSIPFTASEKDLLSTAIAKVEEAFEP